MIPHIFHALGSSGNIHGDLVNSQVSHFLWLGGDGDEFYPD